MEGIKIGSERVAEKGNLNSASEEEKEDIEKPNIKDRREQSSIKEEDKEEPKEVKYKPPHARLAPKGGNEKLTRRMQGILNR